METTPNPHRRDHMGMPIDAVVAVTELNLSIGTVFRLSLIFVASQAVVGLIAFLILFAIGVL